VATSRAQVNAVTGPTPSITRSPVPLAQSRFRGVWRDMEVTAQYETTRYFEVFAEPRVSNRLVRGYK